MALPGVYIEGPADRFVEAMEDAEDEDRLILASRAVRHDPGFIEARLVLAEHATNSAVCIAHLRCAIETGERLWAPVAKDMAAEMTWWGVPTTRPYMRAIAALG